MQWQSLVGRTDSLPLILAGPILRRTEPGAVTVWMALRDAQSVVTLRIYADNDKKRQMFFTSAPSVPLGDHLHVCVVTAKPSDNESALAPGQLYFYDLECSGFDSLLAEGVLTTSDRSEATDSLISYFGPTGLPSFVLPGPGLDSVKLIHGSCRKPHAPGVDALPMVDGLLRQYADKPYDRPQQLFLGGDQIYADDVAWQVLAFVSDAGDALLGTIETLPGVGKPAGQVLDGRKEIARDLCGFTSGNADNHLFSFGEYCAMYLFTWSPAIGPWVGRPNVPVDSTSEWGHQVLDAFLRTRTQVRRALANIATYMICDDHEITDDWNLTYEFCVNTLGRPLGRRVLRNGLVAYALFQGWGNDPAQYYNAGRNGTQFLAKASAWAKAGGYGDDADLERMVSLNDVEAFKTQRKVVHAPDALDFHYQVSTPCYEVIVLDGRTWRAFPRPGARDAPDLLSYQAFQQQIANVNAPAGATDVPVPTTVPVTLVIAPTNVISIPALELLGALNRSIIGKTYEFDEGDSWEARSRALQELLALLASRGQIVDEPVPGAPTTTRKAHHGRVVFLSGDIHFGYAARLHYVADKPFTNQLVTHPLPCNTIFAQLTSSAFKNQDDLTLSLHQVGLGPWPTTQMSVGWDIASEQIAANYSYRDADGTLRQTNLKALGSPPVASISVTNEGCVAQVLPPADWRYRIDFVPGVVDAPNLHIPATQNYDLIGYYGTAQLVQDYFKGGNAGSMLVGSNNLGVLTFDTLSDDANNPIVSQTLYWRRPDAPIGPSPTGSEPLATTRYSVRLRTDDWRYPRLDLLAKWPGGPTSVSKSVVHTWADIADALEQVDKAFTQDRPAEVRALRRLFYSAYTKKGLLGLLFDNFIAPGPLSMLQEPLSVPTVSQGVLNALFETNAMTSDRAGKLEAIDLSHVFAAIDLQAHGLSAIGQSVESHYKIDFAGVFTWSGDLASWFLEYSLASDGGDPEALFQAMREKKAAKDDLLGDMDGQILAHYLATDGPLDSVNGLVDRMRPYYEVGTPNAVRRFHHFIVAARPPLPYTKVSDSPLTVTLDPSAEDAIYDAFRLVLISFFEKQMYEGYMKGRARAKHVGMLAKLTDPSAAKDPVLVRMVSEFAAFLRAGLKDGTAPWGVTP